jgi:phosphatidylserine/phosphatidylglycerophosphate/cardiolipin synthase-like enzyme
MNCEIVDTLFFPSKDNGDKFIKYLKHLTTNSLKICIYSLTSDMIYNTIVELFNSGIPIEIISDDVCSNGKGSDINKLSQIIPVKCDNNKYNYMHNKYAIIDNEYVITGSFNWSDHAIKYNNENLIILKSKDLAQTYNDNFSELWNKFDYY